VSWVAYCDVCNGSTGADFRLCVKVRENEPAPLSQGRREGVWFDVGGLMLQQPLICEKCFDAIQATIAQRCAGAKHKRKGSK
jgi:hypothetical protein